MARLVFMNQYRYYTIYGVFVSLSLSQAPSLFPWSTRPDQLPVLALCPRALNNILVPLSPEQKEIIAYVILVESRTYAIFPSCKFTHIFRSIQFLMKMNKFSTKGRRFSPLSSVVATLLLNKNVRSFARSHNFLFSNSNFYLHTTVFERGMNFFIIF